MTRLQSQWDAVQKNVCDRKTLLEQIEPVASEYRDALQSILSWLSTAEKNIALLKYIPCDRKGPQKYEELLREMEREHDEWVSHFCELDHLARVLLEFNPEDANILNLQVQDVKNRSAVLRNVLKEKESKLEKVKELLENFTYRVHAVEELVVHGEWLVVASTQLLCKLKRT